jgi:predicted kinase
MSARPRRAVEAVAREANAPFIGLWLDADSETMAARVRARRGDASDADEAVLRAQLDADLGKMDWPRLAATGKATDTLRIARRLLDDEMLAGRYAD